MAQQLQSQQRSLEQKRAAAAWTKIRAVVEHNKQLEEKKRFGKEYGQLAKGAPAEIQINGLGQTLAFWRAKGYDKGQPKKDCNNAHYQLLAHLSGWLREQLKLSISEDPQAVLEWIVKQAKTDEYRRATTEAMAFLNWLKRFAEAELGGD